MAASKSSTQLIAFAKRMDQLAVVLALTPQQVVTTAARDFNGAIKTGINAATNGGKLRNVGKRGSRVGVRYTVQAGTTNASAIVQATGPLQIIEDNTKKHTIPATNVSRRVRTSAGRLSRSRELTGRTVSGRKVLFFRGQYSLGPIPHPGTKGKHPFARAVARVERAAITDAFQQVTLAIGRIFK